MIKKLVVTFFVISTLAFSGCSHAENNKESEQGKTMIDLNNMQDWCLGRYTFKLPKDAQIIDETINYDSFKIESKSKASQVEFEEAVSEVESKYSTKRGGPTCLNN